MDDPYVILLESRTVFWEDIGLPTRSQMDTPLTRHLRDMWESDVDPWLKEFTEHDYHEHDAGVWFSSRMDAIRFMLVWNGRLVP